jgi:23S rRNA (pseudouridine1915-N3)-methyltransferase
MIKIKIISTGKFKEEWLRLAIDEYQKRLSPWMQFEWVIYKSEEELYKEAQKEKNLISLSPDGKLYDSEEFSQVFMELIEKNQSRLTLLIGGAFGIPKEILKKTPSFSLSKLTWSHQTVRLLIMEQLYRAYEIQKGSSYHK